MARNESLAQESLSRSTRELVPPWDSALARDDAITEVDQSDRTFRTFAFVRELSTLYSYYFQSLTRRRALLVTKASFLANSAKMGKATTGALRSELTVPG